MTSQAYDVITLHYYIIKNVEMSLPYILMALWYDVITLCYIMISLHNYIMLI